MLNKSKLQMRSRILDMRVRDAGKLVLQPYTVRPYFQAVDRRDLVASLTGESVSNIARLEGELLRSGLFEQLDQRMAEVRSARVSGSLWIAIPYLLARITRPTVVMETGVFDGISSAMLLQALHENEVGELVSIDLPARQPIKDSIHGPEHDSLPKGLDPGWIIPANLQDRHHMVLGDSRELLPKELERNGEIDFFFHDSLHTREHMMFEFRTVWPALRSNGLLLSDDIFAWGAKGAFFSFAKEVHGEHHSCGNFGGFRKP